MQSSQRKEIEIPKGIEGFIFDLDGTLVDTMPLHFIAWQEIAKKFGFVFTEKRFYEMAGAPAIKIVEVLFQEQGLNPIDFKIIDEEKQKSFLENLYQLKPIKCVEDVVHKYSGKIRMSIGSGGRRDTVEKTLKAVSMEKYFDIIVAADDVKNFKPHPETFLKCAEKMGLAPSKCLVFEDADNGVLAAKAAGMAYVDVRDYL